MSSQFNASPQAKQWQNNKKKQQLFYLHVYLQLNLQQYQFLKLARTGAAADSKKLSRINKGYQGVFFRMFVNSFFFFCRLAQMV